MVQHIQRLKEDERPVDSLLQSGDFKRHTFTDSPPRIPVATSSGTSSTREGYIPDPLLKIAPEERRRDGYLTRIFPQFAKNTR